MDKRDKCTEPVLNGTKLIEVNELINFCALYVSVVYKGMSMDGNA